MSESPEVEHPDSGSPPPVTATGPLAAPQEAPHPPTAAPSEAPTAARSRSWELSHDDFTQFIPAAPKLLAEQVKAIEKRVADRIMNELRSRRGTDDDEASESSDPESAVPTLTEEQLARILDAMPAEAQRGRKGGGPDPASFRLWLTVASGRYAGAGVPEIASVLGVDEEIVSRLTESATFIVFEAEFRNALQAAHGADEIRKKVAIGMSDSLDALSWIVKSRNIDAASAIVSAAKLFAAMHGQLASNGSTTKRMVVAHLNLSPQMSDRIAGAVGRRGA